MNKNNDDVYDMITKEKVQQPIKPRVNTSRYITLLTQTKLGTLGKLKQTSPTWEGCLKDLRHDYLELIQHF